MNTASKNISAFIIDAPQLNLDIPGQTEHPIPV
jgi:hypothetical protein